MAQDPLDQIVDEVRYAPTKEQAKTNLQDQLDARARDVMERHRTMVVKLEIPYFGRPTQAEGVEKSLMRALRYQVGDGVKAYRSDGTEIVFDKVVDDGNEPPDYASDAEGPGRWEGMPAANEIDLTDEQIPAQPADRYASFKDPHNRGARH